MGYDMRWRKASVAESDSSYFHLNAFAMRPYANLMSRLGMAFEDEPEPQFPKPEEFGTTWDDLNAVQYPQDPPNAGWTDSRLVAVLKFQEAVDGALAFHGKADIPGIPLHKFESNDGWIVLPVECEAAVRIWQKFAADEGEEKALAIVTEELGERQVETWAEWVAYLAGAARHDGFEVH